MKGQCQLLGSEYWVKVLRVSSGIVTIPIFKIDIPSSSQHVGFHSELPRTEANDKVEPGKVFRPSHLATCEDLGCGKVLEVPVVSNDVNGCTGTLKIMSPLGESFKYHK